MLKRIFKTKKGQGMTEYILIIALIAVVVVVGVQTLGKKLKSGFETTGTMIESSIGG